MPRRPAHVASSLSNLQGAKSRLRLRLDHRRPVCLRQAHAADRAAWGLQYVWEQREDGSQELRLLCGRSGSILALYLAPIGDFIVVGARAPALVVDCAYGA